MFIEKIKRVCSYRQPESNTKIHYGVYFFGFQSTIFFVVIIYIRFASRGISSVSIIFYNETYGSTAIAGHIEKPIKNVHLVIIKIKCSNRLY